MSYSPFKLLKASKGEIDLNSQTQSGAGAIHPTPCGHISWYGACAKSRGLPERGGTLTLIKVVNFKGCHFD